MKKPTLLEILIVAVVTSSIMMASSGMSISITNNNFNARCRDSDAAYDSSGGACNRDNAVLNGCSSRGSNGNTVRF